MLCTINSANNIYGCYKANDSEVDSFINRYKNVLIWYKKLEHVDCNLIFQLKSNVIIKDLKIHNISNNESLSRSIYNGISYMTLRYDILFGYNKLPPETINEFNINATLSIPRIQIDPSPPYIVVHISNNVTYNLYTENECKYIGDSPIGVKFIKNLIGNENPDFDKIMNSADNSSIDLLISDIYNDGYDSIGLPKNCIASSLAKINNNKHYSKDDLLKSLLIALSFDITHHAIIYAQMNGLDTIAYIGDLVYSENICKLIHFATMFRSLMSVNSVFFKHPQYIAPLGLAQSDIY